MNVLVRHKKASVFISHQAGVFVIITEAAVKKKTNSFSIAFYFILFYFGPMNTWSQSNETNNFNNYSCLLLQILF